MAGKRGSNQGDFPLTFTFVLFMVSPNFLVNGPKVSFLISVSRPTTNWATKCRQTASFYLLRVVQQQSAVWGLGHPV